MSIQYVTSINVSILGLECSISQDKEKFDGHFHIRDFRVLTSSALEPTLSEITVQEPF